MYEPIWPSLVERPDFFDGRRQPPLAQNGSRFLEVAVGLLKGGLAFHHSRTGGVAELFDEGGGDLGPWKTSVETS